MGVDVTFKARTAVKLTDDEFADLRTRFQERFPDEFPGATGRRWPDLEWSEFDDVPTIEVATLDRLYSPHYARGPWPRIKAMGDWLTVALGEQAEVRYGGDDNDEWDALRRWVDLRDEYQAFWDKHENEPYYGRRRAS